LLPRRLTSSNPPPKKTRKGSCSTSTQSLALKENNIKPKTLQVLEVLCSASEYDDLPLRHNEDRLNAELSKQVWGWGVWGAFGASMTAALT
jgi:hypothetical protein